MEIGSYCCTWCTKCTCWLLQSPERDCFLKGLSMSLFVPKKLKENLPRIEYFQFLNPVKKSSNFEILRKNPEKFHENFRSNVYFVIISWCIRRSTVAITLSQQLILKSYYFLNLIK